MGLRAAILLPPRQSLVPSRTHDAAATPTHPPAQEAINVLAGGGPADVAALVEAQCAEMLVLAGLVPDRAAGLRRAAAQRRGGAALDVLARMVAAQGGDARYVRGAGGAPPACPPPSRFQVRVPAPAAGWVAAIDALQCGKVRL